MARFFPLSGIPEQAVPGEGGRGLGSGGSVGVLGGQWCRALWMQGSAVLTSALGQTVALQGSSLTFSGWDLHIHHAGALGRSSSQGRSRGARLAPLEYRRSLRSAGTGE